MDSLHFHQLNNRLMRLMTQTQKLKMAADDRHLSQMEIQEMTDRILEATMDVAREARKLTQSAPAERDHPKSDALDLGRP